MTPADKPLPVLDLAGSARERGRAHGEAERTRIAGHFDAWRASLAVHHPDTRAYIDALLAATDFTAAARRLTPGLLDEVAGIAEGAALPERDLFALQLIDEEWAYAAASADKCTTFGAVAPDGRAWFGQNMDLGAYTDGFQLILRHTAGPAGEPRRLVFTLAGVVALMGVSERLGVCVNTLSQVPSARTGLPVAFVVRGLLDQPGADAACAFMTGVPHASGQHYLIASPGRIDAFEASAAAVHRLTPTSAGEFFHTNHPLAGPASPDHPWGPNSTTRLASIEATLAGAATSPAAIEAALSNRTGPHPVCRHGGPDAFTTASMYATLSEGAPPRAWLTIGPPSPGAYAEVAL